MTFPRTEVFLPLLLGGLAFVMLYLVVNLVFVLLAHKLGGFGYFIPWQLGLLMPLPAALGGIALWFFSSSVLWRSVGTCLILTGVFVPICFAWRFLWVRRELRRVKRI